MATRPPTQAVQMAEMRKDMERLADGVERVDAHLQALSDKLEALTKEHTETKTRVDKVLGNVRAFGAGMAAAFTLIGTVIGAGISGLVELFK